MEKEKEAKAWEEKRAGPGNSRPFLFREAVIRLKEGTSLYSDTPVNTPGRAVEVMRDELARYDREVVCVVNLTTKCQPVRFSMTDPSLKPLNFNLVSMGNLNTSIVDIANVLKSCILSNSSSFLFLHNHPSGNLAPSEEDIEVTRRLVLAGRLMGIPCVDHIIVGAGRKEYFSMREHGTVDFGPEMEEAMKEVSAMTAEDDMMFETPFGEIDPRDVEAAWEESEKAREARNEISLHFGKGLCSFFTSKEGKEYARILIPGTNYPSWPEFVVPAKYVHENRWGKGLWMKLPAEGKTGLSYSRRIDLPDGGRRYEKMKATVTNLQLKSLVEAYKNKDREAQETSELPVFTREEESDRGQRR